MEKDFFGVVLVLVAAAACVGTMGAQPPSASSSTEPSELSVKKADWV
jgi:hypothetical protein